MTSKDNTQQQDAQYEYDTLTNDRLIKDHNYDGIQELDNDLPSWWKWLFYITIAFSIVYLVRLFVFKSDNLVQEAEYRNAMADFQSSKPQPDENLAFQFVLLQDEADLAKGKETWDKICAVCHLQDGGGLVGPNMTDNYWIHGNTVEDMFNVITNGIIEKGMIPYKDQLTEQQRLEVISYIMLKLQGTTPANPKAPEGEAY